MKVLTPWADGLEEMEAVILVDLTSQGPGTCFAFALELIREHAGEGRAKELAEAGLIGR